MPHVKLPSGTEMFYSIPTCTDASVYVGLETPTGSEKPPYIDPSRPTLFFVHGAANDSRSWIEQIHDPVMNQNFNMVCVDLPFVGLTRTPKDYKPGSTPIPVPRECLTMTARPFITMEEQAEDCAALIKKLQLPQMHIVGNCVGTGLVYYLLIHHPTLWKSAILLAPATLAESQHNKQQFAELWRSFLEYDQAEAAEVMQGFYSLFFGPNAGPEPERRAYWNRLWQIYLGVGESKSYIFGQWASAICAREPITEEEARRGFTVPICIASGLDHIIHPTAHSDLEALLPTCPSVPFFESHHLGRAPTMLHYTHPKDVNRILCKFVARCEGRRHSVYDSDITGYNKNWDAPYQILEVKQQAAEKVGSPAPTPPSPSKSKGLYSLVQSMRRPST